MNSGSMVGHGTSGGTGSRSEANLRRVEQDRQQRDKLRAAAGQAQLQSGLQPMQVPDLKEGQSRRGNSPGQARRRSSSSSRFLRIFG